MSVPAWPADLAPYKVAFYLQAHRGGTESPFTRVGKFYALSAPRWIAKLTFRGGYDGLNGDDAAGYGPRLDALLADMGGLAQVQLWDWRRPAPLVPQQVTSGSVLTIAAAGVGATSVTVHGFTPGSLAFSTGDYLGCGDLRPHIVTAPSYADSSGSAVVSFKPAMSVAIAAGTPAITSQVPGIFRLAQDGADDAGMNETEVGVLTEYALSFVEDLNPGP